MKWNNHIKLMILVYLYLYFSSCNPSTFESQISCMPYIFWWYTSGWYSYSGCWYVCGCNILFGFYFTLWCHFNYWHISGYSSIINITTNFSYRRDVISYRSSAGGSFNPPWQICLIQIRYHNQYRMIMQWPFVF